MRPALQSGTHGDLLTAAKIVLAHLNARIAHASSTAQPIPVFEGIAALRDAIEREERALINSNKPGNSPPITNG